jgi:hypothetical protein
MTADQIVVAEIELLNCTVTRYLSRETCLQTSPALPAVLDRCDLLYGNAVQREQEGRGEVRPQRVTIEVGTLPTPLAASVTAPTPAAESVGSVNH